MSGDYVKELPARAIAGANDLPARPKDDSPIGKEVGTAMSTPNQLSFEPTQRSGDRALINQVLPKVELVQNLKELEKIENRQEQLSPLKAEIEKARERAQQNADLRASGKIPEGKVNDRPPPGEKPISTEKPNTIEKQPEVYDASGLTQAKDRAQREGKKLVVEVYGPNCGYCKKQDATMQSPEIQRLLKNAIVVKINGDTNPGSRKEFNVSGYPTTEIFTPGKNQPAHFHGEMSRQTLLDALR